MKKGWDATIQNVITYLDYKNLRLKAPISCGKFTYRLAYIQPSLTKPIRVKCGLSSIKSTHSGKKLLLGIDSLYFNLALVSTPIKSEIVI